MIDPRQITGLVLAGGRGSRMGGLDKGLQPHAGTSLAAHALRRLAPQVGAVMLNANRHLDGYAAIGAELGAPVWPDAVADYPGPLAGFLAGLAHCEAPYLVTVPCDSPRFPPDLVARLAEALARDDSEIAIAATGDGPDGAPQLHPVFCLMRTALQPGLMEFIASGQRKIETWTARHRRVVVPFDDADAFINANTLDELRRLQPGREPGCAPGASSIS